MKEGWLDDEYIILFEEQSALFEKAYGFSELLPGFRLVGMRSWDDFLVEDNGRNLFTVPTVPLLQEHLASFIFEKSLDNLAADERVHGKIKWYVTPIVFGGDPTLGDNATWVTFAQHAELVQWWNRKYRELAPPVR
jgi:hypothetical protein